MTLAQIFHLNGRCFLTQVLSFTFCYHVNNRLVGIVNTRHLFFVRREGCCCWTRPQFRHLIDFRSAFLYAPVSRNLPKHRWAREGGGNGGGNPLRTSISYLVTYAQHKFWTYLLLFPPPPPPTTPPPPGAPRRAGGYK